MAIMTHAKYHFNWLMLTSIFGIWASEPPQAWRKTEKAGPDRVKACYYMPIDTDWLSLQFDWLIASPYNLVRTG